MMQLLLRLIHLVVMNIRSCGFGERPSVSSDASLLPRLHVHGAALRMIITIILKASTHNNNPFWPTFSL
jgi:hypothetical protein